MYDEIYDETYDVIYEVIMRQSRASMSFWDLKSAE